MIENIMKIVIKIGGSTLYNNYDIKLDLIKKWIKIIKQLRQDGHRIGVVIGGGKPARQFAKCSKRIGRN